MATIKDIAKLVGVHPSTVSRVIAGKGKVGQATRDRVFAVMRELKYQPNMVARSLASNSRTKILGVVLPNSNEYLFHNPFFIQVLSSISIYAKNYGYYVMHVNSREEEKEVMILKDLINSQWVDGIILTTVRDNDGCIEYLNKVNKPFVVIGKPYNDDNVFWVDNDNAKAMYMATKRVIELGFRNIGFIGGSIEFRVNKERLTGFKNAMDDANLSVNDSMIYIGEDTENTGAFGMATLLRSFTPDAVVTTDDLIAYGACQYYYKELGNYIPVVGFNNTPVSIYRNPAFSTVDIHAQKLGEYAAKLLIDQLEDNEITSMFHIVETEFIERL